MATIDIDETKRTLLAKGDEKFVLLREIKGNLESIGNIFQLLPDDNKSPYTAISSIRHFEQIPAEFPLYWQFTIIHLIGGYTLFYSN